jgi:hypothetical protein
MNIRTRFRNWKAKRRRNRVAKRGGKASLREFVYLDEVSVYSLIASRKGTVPSEVTQSESALVRSDIASKAGANTGVVKGEVSSSLETQQSTGTQVVRKALVQSTFKELFDLEMPNLPLRPGSRSGKPPHVSSASALLELAQNGSTAWAVASPELRRGTLLEFEVELEAEGIFRMSAIMNAFFEIVDENPKLLSSASLPNLMDSYMTNQLVERLLVGLVPIRGRAVNYRSVIVDSTEVIVHTTVLEGLADTDLIVNPLYVVGVTERELFWRDIRRVLFSHSRYSVLCRLGQDGPQSSWTPVKLVDVLKEVSADLGTSIQEIGGYLDRQQEQGLASSDDQAREAAMQQALSIYANDVVRQYGQELSGEDQAALNTESGSQDGSYETRKNRRAAFAELTARLEARFGFHAEPLVAAQLRAAALDAAGFDLEGNLAESVGEEKRSEDFAETPRYLDSNIVAIYW